MMGFEPETGDLKIGAIRQNTLDSRCFINT